LRTARAFGKNAAGNRFTRFGNGFVEERTRAVGWSRADYCNRVITSYGNGLFVEHTTDVALDNCVARCARRPSIAYTIGGYVLISRGLIRLTARTYGPPVGRCDRHAGLKLRLNFIVNLKSVWRDSPYYSRSCPRTNRFYDGYFSTFPLYGERNDGPVNGFHSPFRVLPNRLPAGYSCGNDAYVARRQQQTPIDVRAYTQYGLVQHRAISPPQREFIYRVVSSTQTSFIVPRTCARIIYNDNPK